MPEAADIGEWRGHDVVDAEGRKIGERELRVIVDLAGPATLRSAARRIVACPPGRRPPAHRQGPRAGAHQGHVPPAPALEAASIDLLMSLPARILRSLLVILDGWDDLADGA